MQGVLWICSHLIKPTVFVQKVVIVITKILPRGFEFLKNISFIKKIVEKSQNEGLFKSIQKNKSS